MGSQRVRHNLATEQQQSLERVRKVCYYTAIGSQSNMFGLAQFSIFIFISNSGQ